MYVFLPLYYLPCSFPLAVSFVVRLTSTKIFSSKVYEFKKGDDVAEIVFHQDLPLCGDVRIEFYHHKWSSQKVCTLMHACTVYESTYMCKCISLLFYRTKCSSSGSTHSLYRGTCSTRQGRRGLLWRYGWPWELSLYVQLL